MAHASPLILVTGASGQLGALVVDALLNHVPASRIVATARNTASLAEFAKRDITVRQADYADPHSLDLGRLRASAGCCWCRPTRWVRAWSSTAM